MDQPPLTPFELKEAPEEQVIEMATKLTSRRTTKRVLRITINFHRD